MPVPDDVSLREELRELEMRLLDPGIRRDPAQVAALLADGFVEFGSSGRVFDKAAVIAGLAAETVQTRAMAAFAIRPLSGNVVLATYRAERRDPGSGAIARSLRSSLWILSDGHWQMIFHQGTPVPE